MSREINYINLVYKFKNWSISPISFIAFGGPLYIYDQLKRGDKTLQQVEEEQEKFKSELNEITKGSKKSKNQKNTIGNVKNIYNWGQEIIDLRNDNSRIRSEAIYKAKQNKTTRTGLKILTPKCFKITNISCINKS